MLCKVTVMSPKARYQFMIEPVQRDALRKIKQDSGVPEGEQIRRAIDSWLKAQGAIKADRKRVVARKRP
jgi:hypothetical protein